MNSHIYTTANALTLYRIIITAPIFYLLHIEQILASTILLTTAFISDYYDGRIARKTNTITQLGSILDPVADKLVVIIFISYFAFHGQLNPLYFALSCTRDIAQLSAIPILLLWKKINFKVKPKAFPKWATAMKFIIIAQLTLYALPWNPQTVPSLGILFFTCITISTFMESIILVTFLKRFWKIFNKQHDTFE